MTSTTSTRTTGTTPDLTTRRRPPAPALVAVGLATVLSLFGGYGAIYFTGLEGWDAFGITYVTTYEAISIFGLVSAVALLLRNDHARVGVIAYAVFMVGFTIMKVVTIQELQAIPFGVVGLVVLGLALHPATKRWAP
jgi:hypothetical protein